MKSLAASVACSAVLKPLYPTAGNGPEVVTVAW
jgi:hypothetical protein